MARGKFIGYLRVSTEKQGQSGTDDSERPRHTIRHERDAEARPERTAQP